MKAQPRQPAPPAADSFIESIGLSVEADGLPRIAGRMWGYFIIYGGPVSFAELAEHLQVSRGSISTNARLLRGLGIIERVGMPGDRQDYYQLSDKPYDRLLAGYVERMRNMQKNVETALASIQGRPRGARQRLTQMKDFYHSAVVSTQALITKLRQNDTPTDSRNDQ